MRITDVRFPDNVRQLNLVNINVRKMTEVQDLQKFLYILILSSSRTRDPSPGGRLPAVTRVLKRDPSPAGHQPTPTGTTRDPIAQPVIRLRLQVQHVIP
jgi:hypothetical protein